MNLEILILFVFTSIALTLAPGPDILFVFSQSINQGFKSGFLVSLGLVSGLFFHTAFVSFGFGSIIYEFPFIFKLIKYMGAIYLISIVIKLILNKRKNKNIEINKNTLLQNYTNGLIMNLVNPKVSLFFLSIFPLFLFDETLDIRTQFLFLGFIFIIQAILIFSLVSLFSSYVGNKILSSKLNNFWVYFQSFILTLIAILLIFNNF